LQCDQLTVVMTLRKRIWVIRIETKRKTPFPRCRHVAGPNPGEKKTFRNERGKGR